ncbi:MAG: isopentenyl-diphosphate Delta-isomerase [Flavisolibacter sp.]
MQQIILVNENDEFVGVMEKMEVHRKGLLHRAFSVFIFDKEGKMLLQKRSLEKYHSAGLWTNACCSHPKPGESVEDASQRRLFEELGISTTLQKIFVFTYKSKVENDMIEHEFDHVFAGEYDGNIQWNPEEVAECRLIDLNTIKSELENSPELYTAWFRIAFPEIEKWHKSKYR